MTTIQEQMEERLASRPDKETLAYLDSRFDECVDGYRGLTHACNRLLAQMADQDAAVKKLEVLVKAQAQDIHAASVAIGKLQDSVQKARDAYAELRKKVE